MLAMVIVLMGAAPLRTRVLVIGTPAPEALAGFDVTVRAPGELPDLARYDLVIVSDVPAHLLDDHQAAALDAYARGGGALLVAGREHSLGTGGYQGTLIEKLLPVRFGGEQSGQPEAAVVLVGDGSRSLAKATGIAIDALSPADYVAVLAPDRVLVPPQRAAHHPRIEAFDAFERGVLPLRDAFAILDGISANAKQIIVLSKQALPADLVREIRDAGITVSVATDRQIPARIAAAFQPPEHVRIVAHADIDITKAPSVDTYVTTRAKRSSEVLLESAFYKEPLLARWHYGAGTVAVWTSTIDGDAAFWTQVARAAMRRDQ